MQIMGRDPLPQITRINTTSHATPPTQSFIGSYLNIMALGLGILLVLLSFALGYTRKNKSLS